MAETLNFQQIYPSNRELKFRKMSELETLLWSSVEKDDFSLFQSTLEKIDKLEKKIDLNEYTYIQKWIKEPEFAKSEGRFLLFSYVCYMGNSKMFFKLINRNDIAIIPKQYKLVENTGRWDKNRQEETMYYHLHFLIFGRKNKSVDKIMLLELLKRCENSLNDGKEMTPLGIACYRNRLEIVKMLLKIGYVDINKTLFTPLFLACYKGNYDVVIELLKRKEIDVNKGDRQTSPLHGVCNSGNVQILKELLKRKNIDVNIIKLGYTPLISAIQSNREEFVKILLKRKDIDVNKGGMNTKGKVMSPLYITLEFGNVKIAKMLLKKKELKVNEGSYTPLFKACSKGQKEIFDELLKRSDIKINAGNRTPLYASCQSGNVEFVKSLLERENVDVNKGSISPLYIACDGGFYEIVMMLLNRKDILINKGGSSGTPLKAAVSKGYLKIVREFLKRKETLINEGEFTPLYSSVCNVPHIEIVKELLKIEDIDVNKGYSRNAEFVSPLFSACFGKVEVVKEFLKHKDIDVNRGDNNYSPLFISVQENKMDIFNELLKFSNINVNKGESPLCKAFYGKNIELAKILLKRKDIDVNKTFLGNSPLYHAVWCDKMEIFKDLLGRKDIKINKGALTPLRAACEKGFIHYVRELLKRNDILINKSNPLAEACRLGHIEVVKELLKHKDIVLNAGEKTPFYLACEFGKVEIVRELLKKEKVEVNCSYVNMTNYEEYSPLYIALKGKHFEVVSELLKSKSIDVNLGCVEGEIKTPLFCAIESGDIEIVKRFLAIKEVRVNEGTPTPLGFACDVGDIQSVKELLKREDIDVNEGTNLNYRYSTPLYYAARKRNLKIVKMLFQHKNIDINIHNGMAIHGAIEGGSLEVVKEFLNRKDLLINKKPDKKIEYFGTQNDFTPLYRACKERKLLIVCELLKREDINVNIDKKLTPLCGAVEGGSIEIVRELLKVKNIDVNSGIKSPLYIACEKKKDNSISTIKRVSIINELLKYKDIDVNYAGNNNNFTPIDAAVSSGTVEVINGLLKNKDIYVSQHSVITAVDNMVLLREMLKFIKINQEILYKALNVCCEKSFEKQLILLLQRNIKFDRLEMLSKCNTKGMKEIIEKFFRNKAAFRNEYGSMKEYDIGIKVREFVKVGFVIGMNEYEHLSKLKTSKKDAEEISKMLDENQFHYVKEVMNVDIEDLMDDFDEFVIEVKELIQKEEHLFKTLLVFFFYAGHGVTMESNSLLLPIDFKPKYTSNKVKLIENTFSIKYVQNSLSQIERESVNVVVLDACRSVIDQKVVESTISKKEELVKESSENKLKVDTRGLDGKRIKTTRENYVFCFATDPNSVALDSALDKSEKRKNSPFTISLVDSFKKKGNFEDIFRSIRNQTMILTKNNQNPWMNSSLSFPFMWNDDVESANKLYKGAKYSALGDPVLNGNNVKDLILETLENEILKRDEMIKKEVKGSKSIEKRIKQVEKESKLLDKTILKYKLLKEKKLKLLKSLQK